MYLEQRRQVRLILETWRYLNLKLYNDINHPWKQSDWQHVEIWINHLFSVTIGDETIVRLLKVNH